MLLLHVPYILITGDCTNDFIYIIYYKQMIHSYSYRSIAGMDSSDVKFTWSNLDNFNKILNKIIKIRLILINKIR